MQAKHILAAAFAIGCLNAWCVSLKDALSSKKIMVELAGSNYDSVPTAMRGDFSPEMHLTVKNLTNDNLSLELEPGYLLEAAEPGYQAMLLTQAIDLKLKPNQKEAQYIYAMCTQHYNSGPSVYTNYYVAEKAPAALLQMAQFIADKKYNNYAGQLGVWCISDNFPVTSISYKNSEIADDIQKKTVAVKGENIDELKKRYAAIPESRRDLFAEFNGDRVDRNIVFTVKDTAMVSAGYYTLDGKMIRPIYKEHLLRDGKHSIRYNPYPVDLAGHYKVKMFKDGIVFREYSFVQ